jgi:hypothetical protein
MRAPPVVGPAWGRGGGFQIVVRASMNSQGGMSVVIKGFLMVVTCMSVLVQAAAPH